MRKDKGSGNNTDKFRRKLKRKRIYYSLLAVLFGIMLIPIAATGLGFQKYFYSVLQNCHTQFYKWVNLVHPPVFICQFLDTFDLRNCLLNFTHVFDSFQKI